MQIGGVQKVSLIDWPGKISAVVFLAGCNFRCPFCHNPELVESRIYASMPRISRMDFFKFLKSRKGLLEGVSVTGGEPTINSDLLEFFEEIKKAGFLVKLDTNVSNSEMIKKLIDRKLIDYFAIDIKSSPEKYEKVSGVKINIKNIEKCLNIIQKSEIPFELKTTIVPSLINEEEIKKIKKWLENLGILEKAKIYAIQQFRPDKTLDKSFEKIKPYSDENLKSFAKIMMQSVKKVEIRGI